MAIRRESLKKEKIKNERVSKSPDAVADSPTSKKEPLVEDVATSIPESTSSNPVDTLENSNLKGKHGPSYFLKALIFIMVRFSYN